MTVSIFPKLWSPSKPLRHVYLLMIFHYSSSFMIYYWFNCSNCLPNLVESVSMSNMDYVTLPLLHRKTERPSGVILGLNISRDFWSFKALSQGKALLINYSSPVSPHATVVVPISSMYNHVRYASSLYFLCCNDYHLTKAHT